jgi:hypothetical protein
MLKKDVMNVNIQFPTVFLFIAFSSLFSLICSSASFAVFPPSSASRYFLGRYPPALHHLLKLPEHTSAHLEIGSVPVLNHSAVFEDIYEIPSWIGDALERVKGKRRCWRGLGEDHDIDGREDDETESDGREEGEDEGYQDCGE